MEPTRSKIRRCQIGIRKDHLHLEDKIDTHPTSRRDTARPLGTPERALERKGCSKHVCVVHLRELHVPSWKWIESTPPKVVHFQLFHPCFDTLGGVKLESWKKKMPSSATRGTKNKQKLSIKTDLGNVPIQ